MPYIKRIPSGKVIKRGDSRSGSVVYISTPDSGSFPTQDPIVTPDDSVPNFALSPNITSTQSGNWSSSSTWNLGRVPQASDVVGIKTTHTVTYDVNSTVAITAVGVAGSLVFRTDINTKLTTQHLLVYGPDNSGYATYGYLEIGTSATPVQSGVTATVVFSDVAIDTGIQGGAIGRDPKMYGNGLLVWGKIRTCGTSKSPTFVRTASEPLATNTTITASSPVTGWLANDILALPDSRQLSGLTLVPEDPSGLWITHSEGLSLSSVSGGTTLNLSGSLAFDHFGAYDMNDVLDYLPHVANVSRNVVFQSANPTGTRAHCMFFYRANTDCRYTLQQDMGRTTINFLDSSVVTGSTLTHLGTNQKGRYAWHHHHVIGLVGGLIYDAAVDPPEFKPGDPANLYGANGASFRLIGCSSYNVTTSLNFGASYNRWGITVHGSSYGLIRDNVVYRVGGSGIATEDGSEWQNVFDNNFVLEVSGYDDFVNAGTNVSQGVGRADDRGYNDPPLDLGFEGAGLWYRGPDNYVRNNVMAACRIGTSYVVSPLNFINGSTKQRPAFQGADPNIDGVTISPQFRPIIQYDINESYGGWTNQGMTIWDLGQQGASNANLSQANSTLKNNVVWHVYSKGYYNYVVRNVTFDGWIVRGHKPSLLAGLGIPTGFFSGDYAAIDFSFINCNVQGCAVGIDVNAVSIADYVSTMMISNSYFSNYVDIQTTPGYSSGGCSVVRPRIVKLINTIHVKPPGIPNGLYVSGKPVAIFRNPFSNGPDGANYLVQDDMFVYNYQGNVSDSFRVYYVNQGVNYVVMNLTLRGGAGQLLVLGTLELGATNQQIHDRYIPWSFYNAFVPPALKNDYPNPGTDGACFSNALAPERAHTRDGIIGLVDPWFGDEGRILDSTLSFVPEIQMPEEMLLIFGVT